MKKIIRPLLLATILGAVLSGCEPTTQEEFDKKQALHIRKVNYEGHSYLLYRDYNGHRGYGGITHDANCSCHKHNKKNESYN